MSIKEFLTFDNIHIIVYLVVALITWIFAFINLFRKPNKVIETVTQKLLIIIPSFIISAEEKFGSGHGSEKLNFVLDLIKQWFSDEGYTFTDYYLKFCKNFIELILDTPCKK